MAIYEAQMNTLQLTLREISEILNTHKIQWLLTRFNPTSKSTPDDLDILVKSRDFKKVKTLLKNAGYQLSSHDKALGGRLPGMQINCSKRDRIKIDLHQDFTWRKKYYFDIDFVWDNTEIRTIAGIKLRSPQKDMDAFIVAVNILFEKTYLNAQEKKYIEYFLKSKNMPSFTNQALSYHWEESLDIFTKWLKKVEIRKNSTKFLPLKLVLFSYLQKFDIVSFCYYIFFRSRYSVNKQLPYE